jgi:hypothetical protein
MTVIPTSFRGQLAWPLPFQGAGTSTYLKDIRQKTEGFLILMLIAEERVMKSKRIIAKE